MKPRRSANTTRVLVSPEDWPANAPVQELPVADMQIGGMRAIASEWLPTPDELRDLMEGAPVALLVAGAFHPPVQLVVGQPPEMMMHERQNVLTPALIENIVVATLNRADGEPAYAMALMANVLAGCVLTLETVAPITLGMILKEARVRLNEIRKNLAEQDALREAEPAGRA